MTVISGSVIYISYFLDFFKAYNIKNEIMDLHVFIIIEEGIDLIVRKEGSHHKVLIIIP
jgi:hypothetical protein